MKWRARFRARLRQRLHEVKVRSKGAWKGWREPQFVLAPPWRPDTVNAAVWNYDLHFTRNESILGVFLTVRNELLYDTDKGAALIANAVEGLAHDAAREEVARRANR